MQGSLVITKPLRFLQFVSVLPSTFRDCLLMAYSFTVAAVIILISSLSRQLKRLYVLNLVLALQITKYDSKVQNSAQQHDTSLIQRDKQ